MHPLPDVLPLVAILRGIEPGHADAVADALHDAGFRIVEVPLNSPAPLRTIESIARRLPDCLVGAGTVLAAGDVASVYDAGGRLIVAPNFDAAVVRASIARSMIAIPGVATPTEAFAAIAEGALALKVFPAEAIGPAVLKAWRAVLPAAIRLLPVGGITPESMGPYLQAGADGFGLGSALYRRGDSAQVVGERALRFRRAWDALHARAQA